MRSKCFFYLLVIFKLTAAHYTSPVFYTKVNGGIVATNESDENIYRRMQVYPPTYDIVHSTISTTTTPPPTPKESYDTWPQDLLDHFQNVMGIKSEDIPSIIAVQNAMRMNSPKETFEDIRAIIATNQLMILRMSMKPLLPPEIIDPKELLPHDIVIDIMNKLQLKDNNDIPTLAQIVNFLNLTVIDTINRLRFILTTDVAVDVIESYIRALTNPQLVSVNEKFPKDVLVAIRQKLGLKDDDFILGVKKMCIAAELETGNETIQFVRDLLKSNEGVEVLDGFVKWATPTPRPTRRTRTTTPTPRTTTTTPTPTINGFPLEVFETLKTELDLNPEEVPSISELGELLGSTDDKETIRTLNVLLSTGKGLEMLRAYIESADFTNAAAADDTDYDEDDYVNDNEGIDRDEEEYFTTTTPKPTISFLERIKNYFNIMPHKQEVVSPSMPPPTKAASIIKRDQMPVPVQRAPLPYHYPIPLRPVALQKQENTISNMSPPHLNTPNMKALRMQIATLSKIVKIPPMQLEAFLQQKPRLMQLVQKLSSIPLNRDDGWAAIDGAMWASAKRVLEQDEDMRKILNGPR